MVVKINGEIISDKKQRDWIERTLSGSSAPIIEPRGYSATDDAVKTVAQAIAVTFLWKVSSRSGAGTIVSWIPANNARSKVLLFTISGDASGRVAFQENTGTIGAPTWTTRMEFRIGTDGSVAIAIPEQSIGPTGNGSGATARLEVLAGTGTYYGTMHGFEA